MINPRTCMWLLLLVCCLCLASCSAGVYRSMGVPTTQAEAYAAQDRERVNLIVQDVRDMTWATISTLLAALGAVVSGGLAVKLKRTAAVADAVIDGIELADQEGVKKKVRQVALARGVEGSLSARLVAAGYSRRAGPGKGNLGGAGDIPPTTEA